jgi:6-phosphofructokinase 1
MGRKIGFIPAASRLSDPERKIPLQIYLTESGLNLSELADNVNDELKKSGRVIVVVSEGFPVGDLGEKKDLFGHTEYSSSETTVAQIVTNFLNKVGLKAKGAARMQVPGTDQRNAIVYGSTTDIEEAYKVGEKAALIASTEESGYMATILRKPSSTYEVFYDKVPLEKVANSERAFPEKWISKNRIDVTDDFLDYARPLIGEDWVRIPLVNGIMRFAKFKAIFAEKKLPAYIPEAYR